MASRSLDDLDPRVQDGAKAILKAWKDAGLDVIVTCTYRSNEEQQALYVQGRTMPGPRVTNAKAGQSLHNRRLAMDVVPLVSGKAVWDTASYLWPLMAQLAKGADPRVSWGGAWKGKFKDFPHFEWIGFSGVDAGLAGLTPLPAPEKAA